MTRKVKVFHMANKGIGQYGRPILEKEVKCEAVFHGFGMDYEEFESGAGNYSVAVVEHVDGTVEMVRADFIQFIEPPMEQE